MEDATVKVAVRVRPFNEKEKGTKNIIYMNGSTFINGEKKKQFTYDYNYWSFDDSQHKTTQEDIYNDLGRPLVNDALNGYNCCIFAYGVSGSGKTHTMMGSNQDPGLIPRICTELMNSKAQIEVSYLEIYKEKLHDLLGDSAELKVREHKEEGIYVKNLARYAVQNYKDILKLIEKGNRERITASTALNDRSSRSHAVFTLYIKNYNEEKKCFVTSKINLVDLAGSEKLSLSKVSGNNAKEAIAINKSLSTLGIVIEKLAKRESHIPFRNSILTFLLSESLGGNSKTIMIATISPSEKFYNETLATLRYANSTKKIVNKVSVNQTDDLEKIKKLEDIINRMTKERNVKSNGHGNSKEVEELTRQLDENKNLLKQKEQSWEDRIKQSQNKIHEIDMENKKLLLKKQEEFKRKEMEMNIERQKLLEEMSDLQNCMNDKEIEMQKKYENDLRINMNLVKEQNDDLLSKIVGMEKSLRDQLEKEYKEKESQLKLTIRNKVKQEMAKLDEDNKKLVSIIKDLQQKNYKLEQQTNKEELNISNELVDLRKQRELLQNDLEVDKKVHEALALEMEQLQRQIKSDKTDQAELNEKIQSMLKEKSELEQHLLDLNREYEKEKEKNLQKDQAVLDVIKKLKMLKK